jgi:hypothetical protein
MVINMQWISQCPKWYYKIAHFHKEILITEKQKIIQNNKRYNKRSKQTNMKRSNLITIMILKNKNLTKKKNKSRFMIRSRKL